jgi:hypothetical protein
MRYLYKPNVNIEYESDELEEDTIRKLLNSDQFFCTEVIVTDRKENKEYKYTMIRQLVVEEAKNE